MTTSQDNGLLIERILRDRQGIWRQISEERQLGRLVARMLLTSVVSLALYGAVLGASKSWLQALSSVVKLPILFLATLLICLPTLYLFNLVFGARLGLMQTIALIFTCITVIAVLTLAFAPISLFFLITVQKYEFVKLLNVAILVLTAFIGLRFLAVGMRALNQYQAHAAATAVVPPPVAVAVGVPAQAAGPALATATLPPPPPGGGPKQASMTLLYVWILLFGFVGTQLGWTLRPFFGEPHQKFQIFRNIHGTFYEDLFHTISNLVSGG